MGMTQRILLEEFVNVSQNIGRHVPLWTQGGGGNVSFKSGRHLHIKASGFRLDEITTDAGRACVLIKEARYALDKIRDARCSSEHAEDLYAKALRQYVVPGTPRPSMETGMHLVLPAKWVLHFHALSAIVMAHYAARNRQTVSAIFRKLGITWGLIDSTLPGFRLSLAATPHASCEALLLAQHGIVLQGDDPETMLMRWRKAERFFLNLVGLPILSVDAGSNMSQFQYTKTPWKIYFPDAAVFAEDIIEVLEHEAKPFDCTDKKWVLSQTALAKDRNATELWWATSLLYAAYPELPSIAGDHAGAILKLPSERYRRERKASKNQEVT